VAWVHRYLPHPASEKRFKQPDSLAELNEKKSFKPLDDEKQSLNTT